MFLWFANKHDPQPKTCAGKVPWHVGPRQYQALVDPFRHRPVRFPQLLCLCSCCRRHALQNTDTINKVEYDADLPHHFMQRHEHEFRCEVQQVRAGDDGVLAWRARTVRHWHRVQLLQQQHNRGAVLVSGNVNTHSLLEQGWKRDRQREDHLGTALHHLAVAVPQRYTNAHTSSGCCVLCPWRGAQIQWRRQRQQTTKLSRSVHAVGTRDGRVEHR